MSAYNTESVETQTTHIFSTARGTAWFRHYGTEHCQEIALICEGVCCAYNSFRIAIGYIVINSNFCVVQASTRYMRDGEVVLQRWATAPWDVVCGHVALPIEVFSNTFFPELTMVW